jgi:delta 1-pyrroline-5-carboxylate dehydrogenase
VVTGVDHSMLLMQEETFGPVLAIQTVADAAEAVRLANDSPFGLAASVWTGNAQRGREIATQLHAGTVMVNDVASYYGICEAPHGGRGASGWGRSHSRLGLLEMVQVKYVDVDRLPRTPKSWWFGYNEALAGAADRFVEFLFAPQWRRRLSAAMRKNGALETLFRGHRI